MQEFYTKFQAALDNPAYKYVVVDTLTKHIENAMNFCRSAFKNYDIWTNFNQHIRRSVNMCKSKSKYVIVIAQDELTDIMGADGSKSTKRCAATLAGKEWDGKLEKEFLMVFFTDVRKNPKYKPEDLASKELAMAYSFLTNSDGVCTAKSPMGMFDTMLIKNNLRDVFVRVDEYFK